MTVAESFICYALKIGAIELIPEGRKLKSGRMSPFFFNSGLFNTGRSLLELSEAYVASEKIPLHTGVIFGPAYKGIPLATAIAMTVWKRYEINMGFAFNRKEEKDHGEGGIIIGSVRSKTVCIVDDVITTGMSSGEAVNIINLNGGFPIACVIAFDRQECGNDTKLSAVQEFTRNYKIPVYSIANLADLITVLEKGVKSKTLTANGEKSLEKILIYRDKYGVK